jgi:hypothetical protein
MSVGAFKINDFHNDIDYASDFRNIENYTKYPNYKI